MIRNATPNDAKAILEIYNPYIANTAITFEEEPVTDSEMESRITEKTEAAYPYFVYEEEGRILGYAYAGKWRERSAYRFCAETTVYVKDGLGGKGIGSRLYAALLDALRDRGFHAAMGVVTLPNEASRRLHEKFGFVKSAHFKEVGLKFGRWLDVGYWELLL